MLGRAKEKIKSENVRFIKADIKKKWKITKPKYDLVTCSLILEHIEDIDFIFHCYLIKLNDTKIGKWSE